MSSHTPAATRGRLLSTATALALVAATPAAAQDANLFQALGRIIVGAGTAKVAIDTPQAVTAIEQEEMDREQPRTLSDLFKTVPGVQGAGASARPLGQAFNIRGIGNSEQTASEARIIVTVDGAPKFFEQYRMGSFFGDFELYKRVEVLRGPASSTLYGSGAIGGAVNFTTKDASDFLDEGETAALQVKGGYESQGDGFRQGLIYATRRGNAEFLAALNHSKSGDKTDGAGAVIAGTAHESWSGLLKGTFDLGQDGDQTLTLSASRTDTDLEDALVAQTGGAAVAGFGTSDIHTVDDTLSVTWRNAFSANPLLDLSVQLSYTDTSAAKDNFSLGAMCAPGRTQVLCDSDYGYATTTLKVENTADLSFGAWDNRLITGVQLSEQTRSATSSVGALAFHPEGKDRKLGVYAQGEFIWDDRLTIVPGVRADFGKITPGAGAVAAGGAEQSDTAVSPKLALHYKISEQFAVFGSVARTERMPTLDELYSSEAAGALPARTPSLNLAKEQADTVELGFAWQRENLLTDGDSFQLKATAFNNDLTDMIATTTRVAGGPAVPYFSNIASAKIWGAEIEASYESDRWFGQLAYSQIKSKDRTTGLTLADTPAENVVLTLGAKLPDQNLVLGWRGAYHDNIVTSSATTTAPAYDTHDLFATWSPEQGALAGLDVNFTVENVFDATYRNNLTLDNGVGRNAKLSVSKKFTF